MKLIKIISLILSSLLILLPVFTFNFKEDSVSEIDNRKLTANPFGANADADSDFTSNVQNYVNDRIGFRDDMILGYTLLNDKLFGKMVHPSYSYGKDGYVFGAGITTNEQFTDYHIVFADMVKKVQDYCEARSTPFLFVFNPAKPAILSQYLADGINYNRDWVSSFFAELDKRNVNYLDNTQTLKTLSDSGVAVFNKKYDANHWNDLGAFYGTQKSLEKLKKTLTNVHVNDLSEFIVSEELQTSLMVSNFPINESVPKLISKTECLNLTEKYSSGIELNSSYRAFGYYENTERKNDGAPKALVFQGSYMNSYGYKYYQNAFSEYIYVHDYQNILNFPYYYNLFKPECVIFEVAEYTFSNIYFDYENMKNINFNPTVSSIEVTDRAEALLGNDELSVTITDEIVKIVWETNKTFENVWLLLNDEFDMTRSDDGTAYEVSVSKAVYENNKSKLKLAAYSGDSITYYSK